MFYFLSILVDSSAPNFLRLQIIGIISLQKKTDLGENSLLKNQGEKITLENKEVSFEDLEGWRTEYRDAVVKFDIPMNKIETKPINIINK